MLKRILVDALKYTPTKIIPALISISIIPIITHMFSPEEYGYLGVVLSTISLLSILTSGWVVNSNLRFYELRKKELQEKTHIQSLIIFTIIFSGAVTLFSYIVLNILIYVELIPTGLIKYGYFTVMLLFFNPIIALVLSNYRMQGKTSRYTMVDVAFNSGKYVIGLALIIFAPNYFGLEAVILGGIGSAIIVLSIIGIENIKNVFTITIRRLAYLKEYWTYGYPFIIVLFSNWVITLATRNLLLFLRPEHQFEVGWYTVSQNIVDRTLRILFQLLMLAALPAIYRAWENKGAVATNKLLTTIINYYIILFSPIVLWLSLAAQTIFKVITGAQYWDGYIAVPWLAMSIFLAGLNQYYVLPITLEKKSQLFGKITVASAVISLILNVLLIKYFGFIGGCIATFMTFMIFTALTLRYSNKILKIKLDLMYFIKLTTSLTLMGIVVFYSLTIGQTDYIKLIVSFVSGTIIYGLTIWMTKTIDLKNDLDQIE